MRYLAVWECDPEDFGKVIEKWRKRMAIKEKEPEKFVKVLLANVVIGECKGYDIYETDNPDILTDMYLGFDPEIKKIKFIPIMDVLKFVELYEESKK